MLESFSVYLLMVALLTIVAAVSSLLSFRAGVPVLLVVLGVGLLAGQDGPGGIAFNDSGAAYLLGSVALALILFDSGFGTPYSALRAAAGPAVVLATLGVAGTTAVVAVAVHYLFGWSWQQSLLLGAVLSSTDAAAVFFLLRVGGINLRERVRSILEMESGSNDPAAIFLTVAMLAWFSAEGGTWSGAIVEFLWEFGAGFAGGVLGGAAIASIVNRLDLEPGLYGVLVAAAALAVFAAVTLIGGSGFFAVYLAGLVAGNRRLRRARELRRFQQGLTWLAQIAMFLTLGLLATPSEFGRALVPGLVIGIVLAIIGRPLVVWLCLAPFRITRQEIVFVGFIGLRGAVSILLAILPILAGLSFGHELFNVTFVAVVVSLLLQGFGLKPLAQKLGLVVPAPLHAVDRIQLELPGETAHELIAYKLAADSRLITQRRMPRWMRPALVVREGRSIRNIRVDRLMPGDTIYVFVRPHRVTLLDRLVGSPRAPDRGDREFFGDFEISPETPMSELVDFYSATVKPELRALSVAHFLEREFGSAVEVGDRITLGTIELIVREISGERHVTEAGLALLRGRA
jgi:potassium/hydrogen antiporter